MRQVLCDYWAIYDYGITEEVLMPVQIRLLAEMQFNGNLYTVSFCDIVKESVLRRHHGYLSARGRDIFYSTDTIHRCQVIAVKDLAFKAIAYRRSARDFDWQVVDGWKGLSY